jgi:hypothetical protein
MSLKYITNAPLAYRIASKTDILSGTKIYTQTHNEKEKK